ncbi:MAG: hypothetical protein H6925_05330 [Holosporaceae bacterium]|nr:MAG: hypothetical protein H6925_05330 [Holosporaceae bacterium]
MSKRKSDLLFAKHEDEYASDLQAFEGMVADLEAKQRIATELAEALEEERAECQKLKLVVDAQSALLEEAAVKGMKALEGKIKLNWLVQKLWLSMKMLRLRFGGWKQKFSLLKLPLSFCLNKLRPKKPEM